ncbi:LysR family transcriptional regulator [Nostoc sp. CHAB 5844]|nr:LysR family transcriptional regulator [Nostoc sp. CHAB 5844]
MELRHLRYFIMVAEELHFGRAAQRLNMAQQPLSRQIRDLEAEMGVQLFYRTKRTVRLTEAGQVFLKEASKILEQTEQAVMLAQRTSQGKAGRLAIGFTGPALNRTLPRIVRLFKAKHPQIELSLERMQTNEQVAALISGQLQVGLLHPPIQNDTLRLETVHREPLVVFLPDYHPLANVPTDTISIQALASESFILFPRRVGSVLYDQIIQLCQQAGFSPNVVQEVIPQQIIVGLVSAGIGVSLLHASAQEAMYPGVVIKHLVEPTPELELAVAWHPEIISTALDFFRNIVREVACK